MYACERVCMLVWTIVAYYCVWMYKWCLVYVCVKICTQCDKLAVVYRIDERYYVSGFATGWPRNHSLYIYI